MRQILGTLIFGGVLIAPILRANQIQIDFENLPDGTSVTNQYPGLLFSDATVLSAFLSLNEAEFPPHSGTNVVFDDGGPMLISFQSPAIDFSGYFTHLVPLTLVAYNGTNTVSSISSIFANNLALSGDPGSSPNELISLSDPAGFSSIVITGDPSGGSFTMDDVTVDFAPTTVPEPASLLLFSTVLVLIIAANFARKMHYYRRIFKLSS